MRYLFCSLILCAFITALAAAEDAELRTKAETLIKQLGSEEFERREAASAALKKIAPDVFEQLDSARDETTDAEVKQRVQ